MHCNPVIFSVDIGHVSKLLLSLYRDIVVVFLLAGGEADRGHVLVEGDEVAQPQDGDVVLRGEVIVTLVLDRLAHLQIETDKQTYCMFDYLFLHLDCHLAVLLGDVVLPQQHPLHLAAVGRGQHLDTR